MSDDSGAKEISFESGVKEISLSGRALKSLPPEIAKKYGDSLTKLDLTDNQLCSGKGFEGLTKLTTLILDKNAIKGLIDFPAMKTVDTLWLNNNQISELKPLLDVVEKSFPNLTYLSMLKNPACPNMYFSDGEAEAYQRYRHAIIYRLRNLKMLDALPVEEAEQKEAQRVGKFQIPAKPSAQDDASRAIDAAADGLKQRPIPHPAATNKPPKVASFLGKGKPRYDGANSEGNRFISDQDL